MTGALILAWRLLTFTVPVNHAAPGCSQGSLLPPIYQYGHLDLESSRDSLHWTLASRWGMTWVAPGGQYRLAAYPDSLAPWWRITVYNAFDSSSCVSNVAKVR
jgi:hypothetical protein